MKDYFEAHELICRCAYGCGLGKADMDPEFMDTMNQIRNVCGFPLIVSSAIRCANHNAEVSRTGFYGPHTTGKAIDIIIYGYRARMLVEIATDFAAITGIGISQKGPMEERFIHLDSLHNSPSSPRPWIWSY